MKKILLIILIIIMSSSAFARDKVKLQIEQGGEDLIGQVLTYNFKEEVRKSSSYEIVGNNDEAFCRIRIYSTDTKKNGTSSSVAIIMTLLPSDSYLSAQILYVPKEQTELAAKSIMMGIDQYLTQLFSDAKKHKKKNIR